MKKQLFINGEVARIENNKYYILTYDNDWDVLIEVNKDTFKNEILKYKDVCFSSWNKDLKKQYLEITRDL